MHKSISMAWFKKSVPIDISGIPSVTSNARCNLGDRHPRHIVDQLVDGAFHGF